jgi:hypothetical protein
MGFVVKKGSKARACTSGGMPTPVSAIVRRGRDPALHRESSPPRLQDLLHVVMVNVPPSGIASRALIARLSSAFSIWLTSQRTSHGSFALTICILIFSPIDRRSSSPTLPIS